MRYVLALVGLGMLVAAGCGGGTSCKTNADCPKGKVCDPKTNKCVSASPTVDGSPGLDGQGSSWNCYISGSGAVPVETDAGTMEFGCYWDWRCQDVGDRRLDCHPCVPPCSGGKQECDCRNVKEGTVEATFVSDDICTLADHNAAYRANKDCGWKVPEG